MTSREAAGRWASLDNSVLLSSQLPALVSLSPGFECHSLCFADLPGCPSWPGQVRSKPLHHCVEAPNTWYLRQQFTYPPSNTPDLTQLPTHLLLWQLQLSLLFACKSRSPQPSQRNLHLGPRISRHHGGEISRYRGRREGRDVDKGKHSIASC